MISLPWASEESVTTTLCNSCLRTMEEGWVDVLEIKLKLDWICPSGLLVIKNRSEMLLSILVSLKSRRTVSMSSSDSHSSGASMTNTNFSGTIILLSSSTRGSCTRCRHWLLDRFISNVQVGIYIIADTTLHTWQVFHEATAESSEKILGGFLVIFILVKEETASQDHVFIQWL